MTANPVRNLSEIIPATIASGDTASDGVHLLGRIVCGIYMPASWTAATVSFEASFDNETYHAVQSPTDAYSVSAAAGQYIALQPEYFFGVKFLKIVSSAAQGADRIINIAGANPTL